MVSDTHAPAAAAANPSGEDGAENDDVSHTATAESAQPTAQPQESRPIHLRPVRKDEIVIEERGLYVESWLPERRSRRRPLYLIHGEAAGSWVWERYLLYFAQRGWEGHALNLRGHFWSEMPEEGERITFDTYLQDVLSGIDRLPPNPVLVGHGMGGLLALRAAEIRRSAGAPVAALVLVSPALPAPLRRPARPHELREVPDMLRRDYLGWQSLPEQLRRQNPDLTIGDVLRVQHLLGIEWGAVRRTIMSGVGVNREPLADVPTLVIGGGLDRWHPLDESERLAEWLGALFEPYGAHSHFGLVLGSESHVQVAEGIRAFLEARRL